jgi:hypothetical protein
LKTNTEELNMTDEQINAAVAKASGWSKEEGVYVWHGNGIDRTCWELWDWCNDLNAMHEAEKMLTHRQMEDYVIEVMQFSHEPMIATARQRAEAFLRTLGKWEEAK